MLYAFVMQRAKKRRVGQSAEGSQTTFQLLPCPVQVQLVSGECEGQEKEVGACDKTYPCESLCQPRNCQFAQWSDWFSLGGCIGLCSRQRDVVQSNNECGRPCLGAKIETARHPDCLPTSCSIHPANCKWSTWSQWSYNEDRPVAFGKSLPHWPKTFATRNPMKPAGRQQGGPVRQAPARHQRGEGADVDCVKLSRLLTETNKETTKKQREQRELGRMAAFPASAFGIRPGPSTSPRPPTASLACPLQSQVHGLGLSV